MNQEVMGIEVELTSHFSVVRETLERVGIANKQQRVLYPSCYLLHKRGKFYIISFKNLFKLDGKESTLTEEDDLRQTAIAKLIERWGLVKIVDQKHVKPAEKYPFIFVLPASEKTDWKITHKYTIGNKKKEKQGE